MVEIACAGQALVLLADKAVWWPDERTLLVADAHVGKAASFRRLGVPVPRGSTSDTLERLGALIQRHGARRVVFLGDLLHSAHAHNAASLGAFMRWRAQHAAVELVLVRGNHDDRAGDPPPSLGVVCVDEPWPLRTLALCHHPQRVVGAYALAGHWHPCVWLGNGFDRLRLPCFQLGEHTAVLPAFGSFTGMHPIDRQPGDRVFAIADDLLVPV